jgi:hypothetical protein
LGGFEEALNRFWRLCRLWRTGFWLLCTGSGEAVEALEMEGLGGSGKLWELWELWRGSVEALERLWKGSLLWPASEEKTSTFSPLKRGSNLRRKYGRAGSLCSCP